VTAETDAEGNTKEYQYDKVNRMIAVVDELGGKTSYKYDALDNIAQFGNWELGINTETGVVYHALMR